MNSNTCRSATESVLKPILGCVVRMIGIVSQVEKWLKRWGRNPAKLPGRKINDALLLVLFCSDSVELSSERLLTFKKLLLHAVFCPLTNVLTSCLFEK